jgi:hypothetical protein
VGGIREELFEVVARGVVEGEARGCAKLGIEVLKLAFEPCLGLEDFVLGRRQDAVEAAQDRERQDHILVLAALEGVADQVRYSPQEIDDRAVIHPLLPKDKMVFQSRLHLPA